MFVGGIGDRKRVKCEKAVVAEMETENHKSLSQKHQESDGFLTEISIMLAFQLQVMCSASLQSNELLLKQCDIKQISIEMEMHG